MGILINDNDVKRIQDASSQVLKDALGQFATVVVPAIEAAAKNALGGISATVTLGPIKIEPIVITFATVPPA